MKQNITVLVIIALMVVLPLTTSLLLDWSFISAHTSREIVIYMLMAIEVLAMAVVMIYYLKQIAK